MQRLELFIPEPRDIPGLGRICFEAFRDVAERHGSERDFPDAETASKIIELIWNLPGSFRVAARVDGQLVGSNFMLLPDGVAGLGPITVDPAYHGRGIGRQLMQAALDWAAEHGIEQVRLMQDAYNCTSLSLYASVGFDLREPIGIMKAGPAGAPNPAVRRAKPSDLPALEDLGVRFYNSSRRNELAEWLERGFTVLVHEAQGRVRGYLAPGKLGHGVAENEAVALGLISQISRHVDSHWNVFFCPLRNTSLYRGALKYGCRLVKLMTLMTLGPYKEPSAVWMPSVAF